MSAVLSFVSAKIPPDRHRDVSDAYAKGIAAGLPPGISQTFLLAGDDGTLAIATIWETREALDAMRSTAAEPFARRILREAGGDADVRFFEIENAGSR